MEARPVDGRGRPSVQPPRPIKAMRYSRKTPMRLDTEHIRRREEEAGCFGLLTKVPTVGPRAPRARDLLTVSKEPHGPEQNYGFLKAPVRVTSLFLKKPARLEALGVVLVLSLLLWRLMERQMRAHVESTGRPLPG
ncbi:MAG: transposase, partial [Acidobacteria bacterium Pan2503]|nr:transposase [Candidatus Acidoferrum panamensis]